MRVLILFISLIIVSCSKEPSLLDKCIASNSKDMQEVNYLSKWIALQEEIPKDPKVSREITNPIFTRFYESLNDAEHEIEQATKPDRDNLSEYSYEMHIEVIKKTTADFIKLQKDEAEKICNMQGIY